MIQSASAKSRHRIEAACKVLRDLSDPNKAATVSDLIRLEAALTLCEEVKLPTFVPLLPLCFNLDGKPYTLDHHFPLEPAFNKAMPRMLTYKTGRQVGKSTFEAARSLAITTAIPYFKTLFIFPLYEQVNKFSTQYVRKFIDESPIKSTWVGQKTNNSVLTRSFKNFSRMQFSFASTSAERARGMSANLLVIDERQDLDPRHLPIILETLSASEITDPATGKTRRVKFRVNTGTPKTLDGPLEDDWQNSSMAEWVIPCDACRKANYPARGMDLEKMIGPVHEDIGEVHEGKKPATICARCGRPINPRDGFWHHRYPNRIEEHSGYHVPQMIMPMHYAEQLAWATIHGKMSGAQNYTVARVYNEVHGESYDEGAKLVTETDLKRAAVLPWKNDPINFSTVAQQARSGNYVMLVLGVDWGGGGETEVSFTTAAVLGLLPDGRIDIIYGRRLLLAHDHAAEARELLRIYHGFGCQAFCHDYNGAGSLHETYMIQSGLTYEQVVPMVYYRSGAKDIMVLHRGTEEHHRSYYLLDKARALKVVCEMIKLQRIRSFQYDYVDRDNRGLLRDFTSLVEAKMETARAGEVYAIHRMAAFPDDFAHSVTFGACGIWHAQQAWPNLAQLAKFRLDEQQHEIFNPQNPWSDDLPFQN